MHCPPSKSQQPRGGQIELSKKNCTLSLLQHINSRAEALAAAHNKLSFPQVDPRRGKP